MIRRDSSDFLKHKQQQWEREKAESESQTEWFPFGENMKPGGGSPLRKFVSKEPVVSNETSTAKTCEETSTDMHQASTTAYTDGKEAEHPVGPGLSNVQYQRVPLIPAPTHPTYPYPLYTYPYPITPDFHHCPSNLPIPTSTSAAANECTEQLSKQPQQMFASHYQIIPASAIPISTINIDPAQICPVDQLGMWTLPPPTGANGMRYGIPIPAPLVPQITASIMEACKLPSSNITNETVHNHMTQSTSSNDSSSESGVSGVKEGSNKKKHDEEKNRHEERQSTSDYTDEDPIPLARRSTIGSVTYNYADQIAERRRVEQEREDRERQELLEIERQRRILEDRRNSEEETRRKKEKERAEEDQRRADQFAAAMEKAKLEANLLKRAKLYKHVLRGAAEDGGDEQFSELEEKILGVDIETGRRLLKEVSDVEWHKKQDEVEMRKNAQRFEKNVHNNSNISIDNQADRKSSSTNPLNTTDVSFSRNSSGRRSIRVSNCVQLDDTKADQDIIRSSIHHLPREAPRLSVLPKRSLSNLSQDEDRESKSPLSPIKPEMIKPAAIYCPINRDPLSQREELQAIHRPTSTTGSYHNSTNKFEGIGHRQNEITQSALFGPIATRSSIRRTTMRGTGFPSPTLIPATVQKHPNQQEASSFEESSSGGEGGSVSPDMCLKGFESPLPPSIENVHPTPVSLPRKMTDGFEFKTPLRTRSALSTPMSNLMSGDDNEPPSCRPTSRLMQRLEQKGTIRRDDEIISQEIRRVAETNLSRSPSLASLRGSMSNLMLRGSQLNLDGPCGELPPNLSKFASVNSPARQSLSSMKKTTDRQAAVLERLSRLRESLHAGKNYTPPRSGFSSSRITTPAQTPQISPRTLL